MVLRCGLKKSKHPLKISHWKLKKKERKIDFRFVERKFLAAINLTGSAEGALVPVLLRITHWTKSGLPVSPPGLFPPCLKYSSFAGVRHAWVNKPIKAKYSICDGQAEPPFIGSLRRLAPTKGTFVCACVKNNESYFGFRSFA